MAFKILIMGLPGSGKTTLAKKVVKFTNAHWLNADKVRNKFNDWDFSEKGIVRQVKRMNQLSKKTKKKYVVADFICPLHKQVRIFKPDIIIWMDTIKKGGFENMNRIFKKPKHFDLRLKRKNLSKNYSKVKKLINDFRFNIR